MSAFRNEATKQINGTLYEAIRSENGRRFLLVICLTGKFEISKALKGFDLKTHGVPADWATTTVRALVMSAVSGNCFAYEAEYDALMQPTTLVFVSAEPHSINILERLFNLPS